jgi:1-aminocyclopropane-1-carboxylate deaminase
MVIFAPMNPFHPSRIDTISTPLIGDGFKFDILRDDLIHPIVSGNKWRKLKYIVQYAIDNQFETIVSFGGAYSNHLIALAFTGNYFNIKTVGFVRGNEQRELNHYETTCIDNHMQLIHVERSAYKNKQQLFKDHFGKNAKALFVNEGGEHPLAELGVAEILDDLKTHYNYIILSLGTGTTLYGLTKSIQKRKISTKTIGISSLKNNFDLDKKMSEFDASQFEIFHNFHRGKYAKMDTELLDFIDQFYKETNIKIEPVYTGKMLMALDELTKQSYFKPNDKVLCIHTGGLYASPQR